MQPLTMPTQSTPALDALGNFLRAWYLFLSTLKDYAILERAQIASANTALTLTTTSQVIKGAALTLPEAGTYLIQGTFDFAVTANDLTTNQMIGQLAANGVLQAPRAIFVAGAAGDEGTVSQQWLYTASVGGQVVQLQAKKSGGTGTSSANKTHTTISAVWVGP